MIKSFNNFVFENIPKNKWVKTDPVEYDQELISLIQNAYKNTPEGSFINTKRDAIKSDWLSIDIDEYPGLDATIFYRGPRENETWSGKKLQGIGHDGSVESINVLLRKIEKLLNEKGIWIETSDQLEKVLYKMNVPYVEDEELARNIFPNKELNFIGNKGKYIRKSNGKIIYETIFGKPTLKVINESLKDKLKGKSDSEVHNLIKDLSGKHLLLKSAKYNYIEGVKLALDKSAPNISNNKLLHSANLTNYIDRITNNDKLNALQHATINGYVDIVKLLIMYTDVGQINKNIFLRLSTINGNEELMKIFIDFGANPLDVYKVFVEEDSKLDYPEHQDKISKAKELIKKYLKSNDTENPLNTYKYNESLKDKLKGKSDDEVKKIFDNFIDKLIDKLIENGHVNTIDEAYDILSSFLDDIYKDVMNGFSVNSIYDIYYDDIVHKIELIREEELESEEPDELEPWENVPIRESIKDKMKGKTNNEIFNSFLDKDINDITDHLYDIYKKNPPIELIHKIADKYNIPKNFNKITIIDIIDAMSYINKYKEGPYDDIEVEYRSSYIRYHQLNSIDNKHTYVIRIHIGSGYNSNWTDIRVLPEEEKEVLEYLNEMIKKYN